MNRSVYMRAGIGAILIGVGLSLMLSASRKVCIDCEEESPEVTATDVAKASAEMVSDND